MKTSQITDEKARKIIKNVISDMLRKYNLKCRRMVLFGSRARGESREDSDWDVLVIVEGSLSRKIKREITALIRMELARYRILSDIILQTANEVERKKNDVGYLVHYALREGVDL